MPHVNDEVRGFDSSMNKVSCGESRIAEEQRTAFIDDSLPHLRTDKRNAEIVHECSQHLASRFTVGSRGDDQQRMLCTLDQLDRGVDCFLIRDRSADQTCRNQGLVRVFGCDVFRKFEMNRARLFLLRDTKRFTDS